jgi:hypothetical protein
VSAFSIGTGTHTERVHTRRNRVCAYGCGTPITAGELALRETTPPWHGEADGDADDAGRPFSWWVNTHHWRTRWYHPDAACLRAKYGRMQDA